MSTDIEKIPDLRLHQQELPHTRLSSALSRFFRLLGRAVSWVWIVLIAVVVLNVTMRYLFGEGRIEFEEIQWHLYAIGFLLGLTTCMDTDQHIRVGVFHDRMHPRRQAWVDLYGLLLLFFPFVTMVLWFSLPFVQYSYQISEISDAPGGLPFRWAIKSVLPFSMILLLLAGLSRLSRLGCYLFDHPRAVEGSIADDNQANNSQPEDNPPGVVRVD